MARNNHDFDDLVRLEQLRHIESSQATVLSYASIATMESLPATGFSYRIFLKRLRNRAQHLIHDNHLETVLQQPSKLFLRMSRIILVLALILGGGAALNATGDTATLNIYWLLVVLLGFNFLAMLLWGIGITLSIQGLSAGIVAQLVRWLPFQLGKREKDSVATLATRAWWETCLFGGVGKWRISLLTHQFWLIYLLAGMGTLILLMLAKQYDFVWGTTLLPEKSLPELTQFLAAPMQWLHLAAPDSQQIAASRIGIGVQDAAVRNVWAEFLMGALIIYGVLPRLLLTLFAFLMLKLAEYRYKLDLYLPYYVTLRQSLFANEYVASVIDHDPGVVQQSPTPIAHKERGKHISEEKLVIGVELDHHIIWPRDMQCQENIMDQQSLLRAMAIIKKSRYALFIGVAAHRLPDRGVQRIIKKMVALASGPIWLVLLQNSAAIPITEARKQAWFRLAQISDIPAEHVLS